MADSMDVMSEPDEDDLEATQKEVEMPDATLDMEEDEQEQEPEQAEDHDSNGSGDENEDDDTPEPTRLPSPSGSDSPAQAQRSASVSALQPGADSCAYYDLIPYIASPQATHINAFVMTKHLRWFFTRGQDGYIRRFDFQASITGKVPLTVQQKHPFVDSVQRSAVLLSYFQNSAAEEEITDANNLVPNRLAEDLSPVNCLAVQSEAMWILSGLQNGGIKMYSVRVDEGRTIASMKAHTAAVSTLTISRDEKSYLSGGWDKSIYDWDLNTGSVVRSYAAGNEITGQVSTVALRPETAGSVDWDVVKTTNRTLISSSSVDSFGNLQDTQRQEQEASDEKSEYNADEPSTSIVLPGQGIKQDSPTSSNSFDPLFDEEDEEGEIEGARPVSTNGNELSNNGNSQGFDSGENSHGESGSDDVVLSSCIDGTLSIWDRRQSAAIARISVPKNTPPWCMSACWSADGEYFYAGRRNGTVDEYCLRGNMALPSRSFKLPSNSGPVSAVTAMPNNRSLICASQDNVRLFDLKKSGSTGGGGVPFLIIPGHHGGVISTFYVDPSCRYAFSASGNRGWDGLSTEAVLGYEIEVYN